jgi:hypothetical protein
MADNATNGKASLLEARYDAVVRYLMFSNGGGTVAASAFLGNRLASDPSLKWGVIPLLCFYAGLALAGFLPLGQLTYHWVQNIEPQARRYAVMKSIVTRVGDWSEARTGLLIGLSFVCFVLGGVSALLVILLA